MRPSGLTIAAGTVLLLAFLFFAAMLGGSNPDRLTIAALAWWLAALVAIGFGATAVILAVRNRLDRHDDA